MKRILLVTLIIFVISFPAVKTHGFNDDTNTLSRIIVKMKASNSPAVGFITKNHGKFVLGSNLVLEEVKDYRREGKMVLLSSGKKLISGKLKAHIGVVTIVPTNEPNLINDVESNPFITKKEEPVVKEEPEDKVEIKKVEEKKKEAPPPQRVREREKQKPKPKPTPPPPKDKGSGDDDDDEGEEG